MPQFLIYGRDSSHLWANFVLGTWVAFQQNTWGDKISPIAHTGGARPLEYEAGLGLACIALGCRSDWALNWAEFNSIQWFHQKMDYWNGHELAGLYASQHQTRSVNNLRGSSILQWQAELIKSAIKASKLCTIFPLNSGVQRAKMDITNLQFHAILADRPTCRHNGQAVGSN